MPALNKKSLSERDICSKFITPALVSADWDFGSRKHYAAALRDLEAQLYIIA